MHNCEVFLCCLGITWEEAQELCKDTPVVAACHNDQQNVTLSGPAADVDNIIEALRLENKTASVVDSAGVAFHSPMLEECRKPFEKALTKVRIL